MAFGPLLEVPYVRLIESGQTAPAGRWEWISESDVATFKRATGPATDPWASTESWLTFNKSTEQITFGKDVVMSGVAISPFTVSGTAPELRFAETDQTDPAGRYRFQVTDDVLNIDRAASGSWATATNLISIDEASGALQVTLSGTLPELRFAETDQTDPAGRYRLQATGDKLILQRALTASWATATDIMTFRNTSTNWVDIDVSFTNPSSTITGLIVETSQVRTSAAAVNAYGVASYALVDTGNTANWTGSPIGLTPYYAQINTTGTGIITGIAAFYGALNIIDGVTVTALYGLYIAPPSGSGAVTSIYGAYLDIEASGGLSTNTTNAYGLKIPDLTIGSTVNVGISLGTDADIGIHHHVAGVAANTSAGGLLVGTPVTPVAIAANSLIVGNITASGDILLAVNKGGTSYMAFMADASTGDTLLGVPTGASIDFYIAGTKQIDYAAGAMTFQQATTISTTAGALTLTAPDFNGGTADSLTSLSIRSTGAAFDLLFATAVVFTANRTLTLTIPDAATALTLTGDFIRSGAHSLTLTTSAATNVTLPTTGTLATLAGAETLTAKLGYNGLVVTPNTGAITTGTWTATVVSPVYGGTGIANNVASTITITGAYSLGLTLSAATALTLPTTGTLATLGGTETLTAKTLTAPAINGIVTTTGLTLPAFSAGAITTSAPLSMDSVGTNVHRTVDDSYLQIGGGSAGGDTGALLTLYGKTHATLPGALDLATPRADLAATLMRLQITGGVATANATWASVYHVGLKFGLAGTATGAFTMDGATSGVVTVTVAATAGTWTMTLPAAVGTSGYQLTDAGGTGVTSWAAAGSLRVYKDILGLHSPQDALDKILRTRVYDFRYKSGMGTQDSETLYTGLVAEETPWAMHYNGGVLNPINALGYSILGIQALNAKIEALEKELAELKGARA